MSRVTALEMDYLECAYESHWRKRWTSESGEAVWYEGCNWIGPKKNLVLVWIHRMNGGQKTKCT